jgi:signal transduction histidine kinase
MVLRASQAIATEIDLGKVIARLVGLVLENAGAQRGALILSPKGELVVSATFGDGPTSIDEHQGRPLQDAVDVAQSVVLYVARTQEPVVLDEPSAVTRFSEDPYLRGATPKSVLGLPLLYQARLVGVLYLENRATAGVFNAARVELLALLSSQAAIAIENASLYANLLSENAERRRAEQEVRTLNSELEQRVEERTRQLKEANQELEAFSYSVSHDLRSPLRTIDGFSLALLEDHGETLESDARDALARVRKASLRMHELIDDLLALSRVARTEMVREPVDLSALSREVAAEIQKASPGREVTWVIADGLTAMGDPKMLKIALENMLGNAFKFTGKRAHAKVEFGARVEPDGRRAFFVRDDGAGFDMTYMSKLFGAFQRLHKVDEFEGTGIGLATVRRIIGRHGGQIWAESAVDKGATFSFTLGV